MIANNRIAELIRENRPEEIPEAIADGEFFHMQTLTEALIDLVLAGEVDREIAANAAPNQHDFVIALEHALKVHARRAATEARRGRGAVIRAAATASEPPDGLGSLRIA